MAIPDSVVSLGLGADLTDVPADWVWTDITSKVRYAPGIDITHGRRDGTDSAQPAQCKLTFDNTDGLFSPRNPGSAYFPNIHLNTPLRVQLRVGEDGFGRSTSSGFGTADSGQAWSTGGGTGTDFSTTGSVAQIVMGSVNVSRRAVLTTPIRDCEQVVTVASSAVATGAAICGEIMFRCDAAGTGNEHYRARVEFGLSGALSVKIIRRVSGSDSTLDTGALVDTYSAGTQVRLRARIDGQTIRARGWLAANAEPSTWDCEVTDSSITAAAGVGLRTVLLTGNTNTTPNVQFDAYEVLVDRFLGFVDEWPLRWDKSGNEKHVAVTASGVLRRLIQGTTKGTRVGGNLRSALYREIMSTSNLVAYWPLEGGGQASQAVSPVAGVESMWGSLELGGSDGPGGSDPSLPSLTSRGELFAKIPHSGATSYRVECVAKLGLEGVGGGDGPPILQWSTPGTIGLWRIEATDTEFQVTYYVGASGTTILVSGSPAFDGGWHHLRVDIEDNGANIDTEFTVDGTVVDSTTIVGAAFRWPEDIGLITFDTVEDQALPLGVGHIAVWSSTAATDTPDAAIGWSGEQASDRVSRICTEEGIAAVVEAGTGTELGPQPTDTLPAVLRDAESTDLGLLFEDGQGVRYIARENRYNLTADLELDFDSGHIQPGWEANDDDQQIANLVEVSQRDGAEGVFYEQVDGPLGTGTVGTYRDPATVNVADEAQLYTHAGWRVNLGTVNDYRFPAVGLNFARSPDLIPSWLSAGIGSRVTIANPPDELPGGTLDLQVVGYQEFVSPRLWTAVLNTVPNRPYNVIVLDGTGNTSRFDTSGSTLDGAESAGSTSFSVDVNSGPLWDTADVPFDIEVGGIQVTVTAVSGASSPQTFTVTGATVTEDLPDGAEIKLWRPSVIAL